jgi:hypothetical protein
MQRLEACSDLRSLHGTGREGVLKLFKPFTAKWWISFNRFWIVFKNVAVLSIVYTISDFIRQRMKNKWFNGSIVEKSTKMASIANGQLIYLF